MIVSRGVIQLAVHERGVAILIPGKSQSGPSLSSLASSTVTAPVRRSYRKRTVDLATLQCCCFRKAPTAFTWTCRRTARRSRSPLWNTTAGDCYSATAGPERRAVWRQTVPAVRCRRLCKNGTAAAKLSAVQSEQSPQLTVFCPIRRSRRSSSAQFCAYT